MPGKKHVRRLEAVIFLSLIAIGSVQVYRLVGHRIPIPRVLAKPAAPSPESFDLACTAVPQLFQSNREQVRLRIPPCHATGAEGRSPASSRKSANRPRAFDHGVINRSNGYRAMVFPGVSDDSAFRSEYITLIEGRNELELPDGRVVWVHFQRPDR